MWKPTTTVEWKGSRVLPADLVKSKHIANKIKHALYYIPAHRTLVLAGGYPPRFQQHSRETPFVVRHFSEQLREVLIQGTNEQALFPHGRRLKNLIKAKLDEAIFHGTRLLDDKSGAESRLVLDVGAGKQSLSYMTWTAGQREVIPLILGAYYLLPAGGSTKRKDIDWVVIEEPEMGLHPRGIRAVFLLALDLVGRGYKVVLSTHSPLILDLIWALRTLRERGGEYQDVLRLFGYDASKPTPPGERHMAREALKKCYSTYLFDFDKKRVTARDISSLDPASPVSEVAGWGDLTGLSTEIAEIVADVTNRRRRK